ncbi:MAG TPA: L,D-transpeptidase [Ruminiclostridium sp.]|nr:L,D-transpeptidase [Ruminiclostridium sp.]
MQPFISHKRGALFGMRIFLSLLLIFASFMPVAVAMQEIHINIPSFVLQLYDNEKVIKEYDIALGTPFEQTPTGAFHIFLKEEYPTWTPGENFTDRTPVPPGPDNPLGTRWMEFKPGYGIHGTNKGWDISFPVSGGCIRMHDKDAQELYNIVPIGTPVIISYETVFVYEKSDGLYVKIFPDIYHTKINTPEHFAALYAPFAAKYPAIKQPSFPSDDAETGVELKLANYSPITVDKPSTSEKKI